ncbi:MAG: gamma-glutamylcyclotransferase [Polyangiaceae bacterium]|nr:gamma-glutamylcyclotransferase [Polyangiaceae bacterium]
MEPRVWVFFYGSYINVAVLKEVDLVPGALEVARLPGFDIRIAPRANLVRSARDCVYGILATATHAELSRLYAHAKDILGETYLPEAILAETDNGALRPAMTYICPEMAPRPAEKAYVERISGPARRLGFPAWYVERIEGFLP